MRYTDPITQSVPVLVVGTGISGLFTALKLASHGVRTFLVTKSTLDDSNSRYAQGGIAAVLPGNRGDSLELHLQDTLSAGAGLCDENAARSILSEGYAAIEDLLYYGVPFDRRPDNSLALTREGAHSIDRILHVGGDATGHAVEMTLIERVRHEPLISVMEYAQVTGLLANNGRCSGCDLVDYHERRRMRILSPHVILATGGLGRLYSHTTNPAIATGDGIALAHQGGADIRHMEFIQFHPTGFYYDGQLRFLVSEALRGEGGVLRRKDGERFAHDYHPDGELAPRDIVTRAIYAEMQAARMPHVYLDITHLPAETIEQRFPTILSSCLQFGLDIRREWIPVAPAAHYLMGGVTVDVRGRSTLPGLYAVGETAWTGLHGANRLASNSLLECVVLARRVADCVAEDAPGASGNIAPDGGDFPKAAEGVDAFLFREEPGIQASLDELHRLMWDHVGILRNETGLQAALQQIDALARNAAEKDYRHITPDGLELCNQLQVARLIAEAALHRRESCGAHSRTDDPAMATEMETSHNACPSIETTHRNGLSSFTASI